MDPPQIEIEDWREDSLDPYLNFPQSVAHAHHLISEIDRKSLTTNDSHPLNLFVIDSFLIIQALSQAIITVI